MNGTSALIRKSPRPSSLSFCHVEKEEVASLQLDKSPRQSPTNHASTQSQTFSLQNRENKFSVVYKLSSLWNSVIAV